VRDGTASSLSRHLVFTAGKKAYILAVLRR
jgi:hypothetical protein